MADDSGIGAIISGVDEVKAAITAANHRVEAATIGALKATQAIAKKHIRAEIKGRPRWDHRGKSSGTGAGVKLGLSPHHSARGGGPGILTGALKRGVGGVKHPKKRGNDYIGGVGVGNKVNNWHKARTEHNFPYMKPGMAKAEPQFGAVYAAAWEKAIHKK